MKKCGLCSYVKSLSKGCDLFACIVSAVLITLSMYLIEISGAFSVFVDFKISETWPALVPALIGVLVLAGVIAKGANSKTICATDSVAVIGATLSVTTLVYALTSIGTDGFATKIVAFAIIAVLTVALLLLRVKFVDGSVAKSNQEELVANATFVSYFKCFVKKYAIVAVIFSVAMILGITYVEKSNFVKELFNEQNIAVSACLLLAISLVYVIFFIERNRDKDIDFNDVLVFVGLCLGVTFGVYTFILPASTKLLTGSFAIFFIIVSILLFAILIKNTHVDTKDEVAKYKQAKSGVKTYFTAFKNHVNLASVIAVSLIIASVISTMLLSGAVGSFIKMFDLDNDKAFLITIIATCIFAFALMFVDVALHRIETMDVVMVATAIVSLIGLVVDQLVMKQAYIFGGLFFTVLLVLSMIFIATRIFFVKLLPEVETACVCECKCACEEAEVKVEVEIEKAPCQEVQVAEETVATVEPVLSVVEEEIAIKQKRVNVKKSFEIYLRTGDDQLKENYSAIKNELSSYGIHARMTKARENFSKKGLSMSKVNPEKNSRLQAKLLIRGKFLKLYINVDPTSIDAKYFRIKDVSDKMPDQATYIKVRSKLSLKRALELIALLAEKEGFAKKKKFEKVDYKNQYTDENLSYMQKLGYDYMVKNSVTYDEVLGYKPEWAERAVKNATVEKADRYIYDEITLDDIAKEYNDGDVVDLESLRLKGIIKINCNYLTVKASKKLSKKLFIEAHAIDLVTAQMVIIAGGEVTRLIIG